MAELFVNVRIEEQEVTSLLLRLIVEESDSKADVVTLTFSDAHMILSDVFHEGLSVEIDLGYSDEHALIFRGIITSIRAHFPAAGSAEVEVQAMDNLILLSLIPQTRRWWNTTISQIVRDIAQSYSLLPGTITLENDAMLEETRPRHQVEETDLAFLYRLARDYDSKLYLDHSAGSDQLNFVSTTNLLAAEPVASPLTLRQNLIEFAASFDAFATAAEEHLVTTDPTTGDLVILNEDLVALDELAWVPDAERIAQMGTSAAVINTLVAQSATKRARLRDYWRQPAREAGIRSRPSSDQSQAYGDRSRRMGQTGRGRARGSIWLRPRSRVTVAEGGGRWSGEWYLAEVCHNLDLSRRSYNSTFVCTR